MSPQLLSKMIGDRLRLLLKMSDNNIKDHTELTAYVNGSCIKLHYDAFKL